MIIFKQWQDVIHLNITKILQWMIFKTTLQHARPSAKISPSIHLMVNLLLDKEQPN